MHSATIVIPQSGQSSLTCQLVSQIRNWESIRWPIVIVENGGDAASVRQLHQIADSQVNIYSQPRPGLTAAWNLAARLITTKWLVFLNNDALVSGPWMERLLQPLENAATPLSVVEVRWESTLRPALQVPSGWCFAIRRDCLLQLGGFDEALQLYFSDTDLFLRARKIWGPSTWTVVHDLPIRHLGHQTTRRLSTRQVLWRNDYLCFMSRWGSRSDV